MQLDWLDTGEVLDVARGDVVVCIPIFGHEHFPACLRSVLEHTPTDVKLLICDDASPDRRSEQFVRELAEADASEHHVFYLLQPRNLGFPGNVNAGFAAAAPADVVLVNSDVVVGEGWLEGLRDAANSDSTVATVTALTNHGSIVSVPARGKPGPLPQEWTAADAAAAVRGAALRLRPRLPTAIGHCILIRRSALDLVGDFDLAFTPGYGEEVDFSQRCIQAGLCHVVADEVFVLHHGSGTFSRNERRSAIQEEHEQLIAVRYPYYHDSVRETADDPANTLARALGVARRALEGMSVIVDGRILAGATTGTQIHAVELIAALARTRAVKLTVLIPDRLSGYAESALAAMPEIERITSGAAEILGIRADLIHRPFQVGNPSDMALFTKLADRVLITNQDLIGFHNPSYFPDFDAWHGYRQTTRTALAVADRVVFFSAHACSQALAEDLVEPNRATVVHIGVDHVAAGHLAPVAPRGYEMLPADAEVMLCIGTDFRHKNRLFALKVLEQLQLRHGWAGRLVLAGPSVERGSSEGDEEEFLARRPAVAAALVRMGALTEPEKEWLYERSRLVFYPTVHEGFGLVPFEAADHHVPCMWAAGTSLSEVLPDKHAAIVTWDAGETADAAHRLLSVETARETNLKAIGAAAKALTWDATAAQLVALYREVCDGPPTPGIREGRSGGLSSARSEDAVRLVGPDGLLPLTAERPLLVLATHPQVGRPFFASLRIGYRLLYALARRLSGPKTGA